ncbi:helix-turn-helix transcriptional regulator [Phenylobacterium sp. VNQ135]|uniref:helix-turn-helix transcriptional regulator n=1 Tax=Phenylobacterium sp. VNQ135 TaxID=3400922 RepID=UPI003C1299E7
MSSPTDIGNAVREARRALGLRQPELAAAAGVGLRFIVDLEGGKNTVQLDRVLAVLHVLGLDLDVVSRVVRANQTHQP